MWLKGYILRELETQKQRIVQLQKKIEEKDVRLKFLESQQKESEDGAMTIKKEMETSIFEEKRARKLASELQREKNELEEALEKTRSELSEFQKKSGHFEEKHISTLKELEQVKNQRDKIRADYHKLQNSSTANLNELGSKNEEVNNILFFLFEQICIRLFCFRSVPSPIPFPTLTKTCQSIRRKCTSWSRNWTSPRKSSSWCLMRATMRRACEGT
jgi:hypothetical protein